MSLSASTRLGSYEVVAQIGAGGMGEVYEARDTKLGRNVAIKVLPAAFVDDPERLSRFQREARMLAALNHPNIATIHGLEHSDGTHFLIMELVQGETLAERVRAGPVPVEEALQIAVQIAEALEAAHEKNIIHRDLKPANVKVTPEGKVKVLDFGLAKAFEGDAASEDMSNSPTLSRAATMQGVILGTAAYMSPEQARGKFVDKRTDLWAFGCVLYEMLTGKPAFHGDDITDILAAVVRAEPDWSNLPGAAPQGVRRLVRRCLQKDKALRIRDAGDVRMEVQEALAAPKDVGAAPVVLASRSKLPWAVAAVTTIAALSLGAHLWRATRPPELKPLVHLDVDLGSNVSLGSLRGTNVIISPDGTRIVYVSQGKLFTRKLDQPKGTELVGSDGAMAPFFSPDGQWVGFFAAGKLEKISVEGGAPVVLCVAPLGYGGSWGEDGNILAELTLPGALSMIPSSGGKPTPVTELAPGEFGHGWPQILPGGKAVLFTSTSSNGVNIEVMSLKDHRRKILQRGGSFGRYFAAPSGAGYLLYLNSGIVFAETFDPNALEVRGSPIPVLDQVARSAIYGFAEFDFSQTGMFLYRSSGVAGAQLVTVQWLDREGKTQPLLARPGPYMRPHVSPGGDRLAMEVQGESTDDVWIYEWRRDTMTRVTFRGIGVALNPVWTPDGRYIVFAHQGGLFWTRADGAGKPQLLIQSKDLQFPFSFAPDGKRLAWMEEIAAGGGEFSLWTAPVQSDSAGLRGGKPEVFLQDGFDNRHPVFSPDGRWLAYDSDESGVYQVYVRSFPDKGGKWQISNAGGTYPIWSNDGRELFFRSVDNRIMTASYTVKGDSFAADQPRVWSEKHLADFGITGAATYDVAPDGKRVAALMPAETSEAQQAQTHVIFLENFFDELRRRVPTGK